MTDRSTVAMLIAFASAVATAFLTVALTADPVRAQTAGGSPEAGDGGPLITVGTERVIATDIAPLTEPHVSAHPDDPSALFVTAISIRRVSPYHIDCVALSSADGGDRWQVGAMSFPICGNPWTAVLRDGTALFTALAEHEDVRRYRAEMRVYRSPSGDARGFTHVQGFAAGFDYPKILADETRDYLYVVGARQMGRGERGVPAILIARSSDGGRIFPDTTAIVTGKAMMEAQVPVVLSDGRLLVPYTEHADLSGNRLARARSWLITSRDHGRTFADPMAITDECHQRLGWAYLAADLSDGPYRDRIYWMCTRQDEAGIWIRMSDDAGASWSEWVRVDRGDLPGDAVVPALAVSPRGALGITWLQRSGDDDPCSFVYFSASGDGGRSFAPPVRVSSAPSCPARDSRNAAPHTHRRLAGGDYNGLAAASDGAFHLVWADARSGVYQLYHARVTAEPER